MSRSAYARAGVDIEKADRFTSLIGALVRPTLNANVHRSIGGYAGLYRLREGEYLAATTDGVGTKLKLAFALKTHDTVGIDLVAMSVNDLVCVGATPLFFLDYFATGKLSLATAEKVLKGIVEGCRQGRVALIGGETAEMPGIYASGEYDLAGFAVGTVSQEELLDGSRVRAGDVLIGLESSGPHSNGYSLIRKLVKPPEKKLLRECLKPTRIYVDAVAVLRKRLGSALKGLAHVTGSGFLNIPRVNESFDYEIRIPESYERPRIFAELVRRGKLSLREAYTTFNMGFGMVAAVDSARATVAVESLRRAGYPTHVLGEVRRAEKTGRTRVLVYDEDASIVLD